MKLISSWFKSNSVAIIPSYIAYLVHFLTFPYLLCIACCTNEWNLYIISPVFNNIFFSYYYVYILTSPINLDKTDLIIGTDYEVSISYIKYPYPASSIQYLAKSSLWC